MRINHWKIIFNPTNEIRALMSSKSKIPTHYETLEVSQNCTQDDIKSAYYELSKKYHPDKNVTKEAKVKFQNVSDAYEILGNYHKRKEYDRDLRARGVGPTRTQFYTETEDQMNTFFRSRINNLDSRNKHIYNFDTWTEAHYGHTLRKSLKAKQQRQMREELRNQFENSKKEEAASVHYTTFLCFCVLLFATLEYFSVYENHDQDLIEQKKKDKNKL